VGGIPGEIGYFRAGKEAVIREGSVKIRGTDEGGRPNFRVGGKEQNGRSQERAVRANKAKTNELQSSGAQTLTPSKPWRKIDVLPHARQPLENHKNGTPPQQIHPVK